MLDYEVKLLQFRFPTLHHMGGVVGFFKESFQAGAVFKYGELRPI